MLICPRIFLLSQCKNAFTSESRLTVSVSQVLTTEVDAQQIWLDFFLALTTHTIHRHEVQLPQMRNPFQFCTIILCCHIVPCNSVFHSRTSNFCVNRQSPGDYTILKRMMHLSMNFDVKKVSDINREILITTASSSTNLLILHSCEREHVVRWHL